MGSSTAGAARNAAVEERKRELGQSIRNVNAFLSLVGFASLFLGAIGVAQATVAAGKPARPNFIVVLVEGTGGGLSFELRG